MNSLDTTLPLTEQMVEALRLHDEGKPNNVVAHLMGVNSRRASELTRMALLRSGRPLTTRRRAQSADARLMERIAALESRAESLRQRVNRLERQLAAVHTVTHRRKADGGIGGRQERRAA